MDTTTTTDYDWRPTDEQVQAEKMGLPRSIWTDGVYRIVLYYDAESNEIRRTPERLTGHDLLGNERWETLGERSWSTERNEYVTSADWQYLAHSLAVTAAPWTKQQTEEQSPPAWPPVHQDVVDTLLEIAVEAVHMRDKLDSESGQLAVQLELAALNRVARAAGIANLEERATAALRRSQHASRDDSTT
jgi:hypothetical protein